MFLQFFTSLRDAQVPVTLREYLTLMEALDADLALYEAKRRGRNRSIVSSALKQQHGSEAEAQSVCMG